MITPEPEKELSISISEDVLIGDNDNQQTVSSAPESSEQTQSNLNRENISAAVKSNVDEMEAIYGWKIYEDAQSKIRTSVVPGYRGKAIKLDYSFQKGKWCGIWKEFGDISSYKAIRFTFRCEGAKNTLEIKIEDKNKTVYGRKIPTTAKGWTIMEIPFSMMNFWWGEKTNLDLSEANLHFAISVKEGDESGSGSVFLDKVEFISQLR